MKMIEKRPMTDRFMHLLDYAGGALIWLAGIAIALIIGVADAFSLHLTYLLKLFGIKNTEVPKWLAVLVTVLFTGLALFIIIAGAVTRILRDDRMMV